MKKQIICRMLIPLLIALFFFGEIKAQVGTNLSFVSMKLVNRVDAAFGGNWHSTDTTKTKGLVLKLKMLITPTMQPIKTVLLTFDFEHAGQKYSEPCMGVTLMSEENEDGFWMLNDRPEKGFYELTAPKEEKVEYVDFLFPIVAGLKSGLLKYDGKVILEKIKIIK